MNGFDRSSGQEAEALEPLFPDDYSPDEMDFAHEVRTLFPIEDEVLPPYFVQTMMDDTFTAPLAPSDERTLISSVFARLRVAREPLLAKLPLAKLPVLPSRASFVETIAQVSTFGRSVVAAASMALAAMLLSVVLTGPAFAEGLWLLLGHTGVQQVSGYPTNVRIPTQGPGTQAQNQPIPLAWLGRSVGDYVYVRARFDSSEAWSNGPIVDMQYRLQDSSSGSGTLTVREFQVNNQYAAVLQVVKAGSAEQVQVGDTPAIYVDGGWVSRHQHGAVLHEWQTGVRSALIFERGGVIFWIVGDQRDGMNQAALLAAASHLQPVTKRDLAPDRLMLHEFGAELPTYVQDPNGQEVYAVVPHGVTSGADQSSLVQYESRWHFVEAD